MTWSINFDIKDGGIDAESIRVVGKPPEGAVQVSGWENGEAARSLTANVGGLQATAYTYPTAPRDPLPDPAADAEAASDTPAT